MIIIIGKERFKPLIFSLETLRRILEKTQKVPFNSSKGK